MRAVTSFSAVRFEVLFLFNVRFRRLDVTAADSRPVHLPKAVCQGIMRHLVVKFRIWQNALKPKTADAKKKGSKRDQSDDFPFPNNYIIYPFASSQTHDHNCAATTWPLFGHGVQIVCHVRYIGRIWLLQVLSLWQTSFCFVFLSFLVRSFPRHGRTFRVAHTESRGQGVPSGLFTATARPCDTNNKHAPCDNYDLREQIMWQLLKLPGRLLRPAGSKWITFFFHISGMVRLSLDTRSVIKYGVWLFTCPPAVLSFP